jgi:hypothetical protein
VRSKNDKKDSVVLARYGLTQKPIAWEPETPEIRILKALASRLDAIEKDILRVTGFPALESRLRPLRLEPDSFCIGIKPI